LKGNVYAQGSYTFLLPVTPRATFARCCAPPRCRYHSPPDAMRLQRPDAFCLAPPTFHTTPHIPFLFRPYHHKAGYHQLSQAAHARIFCAPRAGAPVAGERLMTFDTTLLNCAARERRLRITACYVAGRRGSTFVLRRKTHAGHTFIPLPRLPWTAILPCTSNMGCGWRDVRLPRRGSGL